jgi:hypothetical protein
VEAITRSTDSFSIEGHGLEGMVSADDYRNVQLPFKAEEDETLASPPCFIWKKKSSWLTH